MTPLDKYIEELTVESIKDKVYKEQVYPGPLETGFLLGTISRLESQNAELNKLVTLVSDLGPNPHSMGSGLAWKLASDLLTKTNKNET